MDLALGPLSFAFVLVHGVVLLHVCELDALQQSSARLQETAVWEKLRQEQAAPRPASPVQAIVHEASERVIEWRRTWLESLCWNSDLTARATMKIDHRCHIGSASEASRFYSDQKFPAEASRLLPAESASLCFLYHACALQLALLTA